MGADHMISGGGRISEKKIKQTEWEQKKQLDVRLHPKIKKK